MDLWGLLFGITCCSEGMNIERFHNELAMRLGYERIVNDRRIAIEVEESDEPLVTLKAEGLDVIRFRVSDTVGINKTEISPALQNEISIIANAVQQAYIAAQKVF